MAALLDRINAGLSAFRAPGRTRTFDNIMNLEARLGSTPNSGNQAGSSTYGFNTISWNRQALDSAYGGSWLVGVAVDAIADDMTKAGVAWKGDFDPDEREALDAAFAEMALWEQLGDVVRWARLYGGAIGVLLIDGQDVSTPLRVETIRRDQFKGILVLDRWMVNADQLNVVLDFGPDYGLPQFYQLNVATTPAMTNYGVTQTGGQVVGGQRIHHTRTIRFDGQKLPFYSRQQNNGWGQSVVQRLYDRLLAFDSATQGAAQLVYKAHLRLMKIEGLRETMAMGGDAARGLIATIEFMRRFQTNEGLTITDKTDDFETFSYSFQGLPELLAQFAEQIAGAVQIPMVRLFGQSPAGFSTGDADLQNYYETVSRIQNRTLRRGLMRVLEVMSRSLLGKEPPKNAGFDFNPLALLKPGEKADVAAKVTAAVGEAFDKQIIGRKTAMEELRSSAATTGVFGHISDEDIDDAENDPPKPDENATSGIDPNNPGALSNGPSASPVQRPRIAVRA